MRAAAALGDSLLVGELLSCGVSFLVADANANTALHLAASAGRKEVCRLLVRAGADPRGLTIESARTPRIGNRKAEIRQVQN